jgi:hypothetical protein
MNILQSVKNILAKSWGNEKDQFDHKTGSGTIKLLTYQHKPSAGPVKIP